MEWHRLSYLFINFALLVFHVPATPSFLTKWWQSSELSPCILGASSFTRLVRRCTTKIWVTFVDTQIVSKVYGVRGFMTDNSVVLTKPPVILSCYETSHPTFVLMIVSQILVVWDLLQSLCRYWKMKYEKYKGKYLIPICLGGHQ